MVQGGFAVTVKEMVGFLDSGKLPLITKTVKAKTKKETETMKIIFLARFIFFVNFFQSQAFEQEINDKSNNKEINDNA